MSKKFGEDDKSAKDQNFNNLVSSSRSLEVKSNGYDRENPESIFENLRYICSSADLITKSLAQNCDVAQLPDGRIIVTETRKVHVLYEWSKDKNKMVKISQT